MWWSSFRCERALLFDFDGVIADSLEIWHHMLMQLSPPKVRAALTTRQAFLQCFATNAWRGLRSYGCRRREVAMILARLAEAAPNALKQTRAFPEMVAVVNDLAQRYPCAVVTSNHGPSVAQWCRDWGIRGLQHFHGVEVSTSKVRKIRRLQRVLRARELIYTGDTAGDYYEARRAGAHFIGVAWGWHGADHLRNLGAQVVTSPAALGSYLQAPLPIPTHLVDASQV